MAEHENDWPKTQKTPWYPCGHNQPAPASEPEGVSDSDVSRCLAALYTQVPSTVADDVKRIMRGYIRQQQATIAEQAKEIDGIGDEESRLGYDDAKKLEYIAKDMFDLLRLNEMGSVVYEAEILRIAERIRQDAKTIDEQRRDLSYLNEAMAQIGLKEDANLLPSAIKKLMAHLAAKDAEKEGD